MFVNTFFVSQIDDVIGMSHRKKLSEGKLQIQYLMITTREITSNLSIRFSGHFIKSTEFDQNFKTRTVSLNIAEIFEGLFLIE